MELGSYNGWENKFTWLVHLHLSNEQSLMNEVIGLVARTSDEVAAGRLVEQWVQTGITVGYTASLIGISTMMNTFGC